MKNSGWVVGRPMLLIVACLYGALTAGADDGNRSPVPDAASLEAAEKLARDVFAQEYSEARTDEDRAALAKKILGVAAQSGNASAEQFVLFRVAGNIAKSASDSPQRRLFASGDAAKKLILWDVGTRQKLQEIQCDDQVNVVSFSPDGGRLVSAEIDGKVLLWTVQARQAH